MGSYSKTAYLAIKAETTENTAVKPDVFIPLMSEDIVTQWNAIASTPISANRSKNIRPLKNVIEAPNGTINLLVEPKTFGYFLKGVFGSVTSGQYMKISSASGDFTVGETITGGSSTKTATVVASSTERNYLLLSSASGDFTDGETITGGTSGTTATVVSFDTTVYGHQFTCPQSSLPTFTIEIGLDNEAYRYTGVRLNSFSSIAQSDNIITAGIGITARTEFKHARVTSAVSSGSGSITISVDQTTGLATSDTIKVYRPGTGYLDFSASGNKTHTIGSISGETSITVTNLQTSLQVGDLIVLAPQTPTYSVVDEFTWIGGSLVTVDDTIDSAVSGSGDSIEDFKIDLINEIESKHGADGTNIKNRFPAKAFLKGLEGNGQIVRTYTDMTYLDRLRNMTETAIYIKHTADQISSTGLYYGLEWYLPRAIFQPFNPSLSEDDLLNQEMNFDLYYSSNDGYFAKALLINDKSSY